MRTFKTNSLICAVILWSLTAAAAQNFVFAAVQKLTFEDTPTAIQTPSVASQTSLIYFNSQSKEIVIESTKAIGNVAIYDLTGRVVNIPFFKKMEYLTTIDVSHLPAGVYIVKTAADVKKLIINH
ncbi:MAG: T9SS type A sorting domain-containing protein [Candidatus Symbiothrix sp.]|nr:T9SS type A sorting domain-containing protein [Candidatus Symbiothrix sp.]